MTWIFLVVAGLLTDPAIAESGEIFSDAAALEVMESSDRDDEIVLTVCADSVRVVRPGRLVGRSVEPSGPLVLGRGPYVFPGRRLREGSANAGVRPRLFGGLAGIVELKI
jgi:hypothetical protein